jgi:hypothetical protein
MHADLNQFLAQDHLRTLRHEAETSRLAAIARSSRRDHAGTDGDPRTGRLGIGRRLASRLILFVSNSGGRESADYA